MTTEKLLEKIDKEILRVCKGRKIYKFLKVASPTVFAYVKGLEKVKEWLEN